METWHNRLDEALAARGLEWIDLFNYMNKVAGMKKPSVYAWKPDATKRNATMEAQNAVIVSKWLGVNIEWLILGTGDSGLTESPENRIAKLYRLLSDKRKTKIEETLVDYAMLEGHEDEAMRIASVRQKESN